MKTTTTNTTKIDSAAAQKGQNTMNNKQLFIDAHAAARKIRAEYKSEKLSYRVCFSAALKEAYKAQSAAPVSVEWAALLADETQLYKRMFSAFWYCERKDNAETDKQGNFKRDSFKYVNLADESEILSVIHGAIVRIYEYLAKHDDAELKAKNRDLQYIICAMLYRAALDFGLKEKRHISGLRHKETQTEISSENMYCIDMLKESDAMSFSTPYEYAAVMETLESACNDNLDRKIMLFDGMGFNSREIGDFVGTSKTTVNNRIKAYKARHDEQRSADAAAAESAAQCDMLAYRIRKRLA